MSSATGFERTERIARREHRCSDCGRRIEVGERYADVVAFPRYDFNPQPGRWTRGAFCIPATPEPVEGEPNE